MFLSVSYLQLKGGEYYFKYNMVLGLFGESDEALTVLLKDNRIMDWTKNVVLAGWYLCCFID